MIGKLLKRLAKYILHTEIQTLNREIEREKSISKDLKAAFMAKSLPVEFFKVIEEKQIAVNDLAMLKHVYIRLLDIKQNQLPVQKVFEQQYAKVEEQAKNMEFWEREEFMKQPNKALEHNKLFFEKLNNEINAVNTIISKLDGII